MSASGLYSKYSAAGSRLTTSMVRRMASQCACMVAQYVDFPHPAGPTTNWANRGIFVENTEFKAVLNTAMGENKLLRKFQAYHTLTKLNMDSTPDYEFHHFDAYKKLSFQIHQRVLKYLIITMSVHTNFRKDISAKQNIPSNQSWKINVHLLSTWPTSKPIPEIESTVKNQFHPNFSQS